MSEDFDYLADTDPIALRKRAHELLARAEKAETKLAESTKEIGRQRNQASSNRHRAEKAEAKVAAVRELCNHASEQSLTQDDVWQDIEDPTPIPGWVTMVRRAVGEDD